MTPTNRSAFAAVLAGGLAAGAAHAANSDVVMVNIRVKPVAWIECPGDVDFHLYVPDDGKHDNKRGKGHDSHGNGKGHDNHGSSWPRLIKPVVVPFKVRGNVSATVSARPELFLRVKSGAYLGKALPIGGGHWHNHGNGHDYGHNHGNGHDHDHGHGNSHGNKDKNKHGKSYGHSYGHGSPSPPSTGALGYNVIMQFPIASWSAANPNSWEVFLASYLSGFASLSGINNQGTRPLSANLAQRPRGTYGVLYIGSRVNWTADGKEAAEGKYGGSVLLTLTPLNN